MSRYMNLHSYKFSARSYLKTMRWIQIVCGRVLSGELLWVPWDPDGVEPLRPQHFGSEGEMGKDVMASPVDPPHPDLR